MSDREFQDMENARHDRRTFLSRGGLIVTYIVAMGSLVVWWVTYKLAVVVQGGG